MWHVKDYGLQVAGQEVAKTALKTANGNHMRFCTAKNTGSGKHEQTKSTQSKGMRPGSNCYFYSSKGAQRQKCNLFKTIMHPNTYGHRLSYLQETEPVPQMSCLISKLQQQPGSISINPCLKSQSTTKPTNQPTQLSKCEQQQSRPHVLYRALSRYCHVLVQQSQPRYNSQNFRYVTGELKLGPAATKFGEFCFGVPVTAAASFVRASCLLVGTATSSHHICCTATQHCRKPQATQHPHSCRPCHSTPWCRRIVHSSPP